MTNGEKIKEIFPSTDSRLDERTGIMLVKWVDGATKCFKADWWNAEYKEPTTKNDLGVNTDKLISDCEKMSFDIEIFNKPLKVVALDAVKNIVNDLPSVTPQEPQTFKWCTDCKEYDQEKHCCHRWSKVIRDAVKELKQEPIIDKIRAEIEKWHKEGTNWSDIRLMNIEDILDKYKAETEG